MSDNPLAPKDQENLVPSGQPEPVPVQEPALESTPEPVPEQDQEHRNLVLALLQGGSVMDDLTPTPMEAPTPPAAPAAPAMDPAMMQRIAAMEQALGMQGQRLAAQDQVLGDYRLNQELADLRGQHGQMLQHFGATVPEDFGALEQAVLKEYKDLIEGNAPLHQVAYQRALLNQALQGEGTLQDRILAAAAKNAPPVTPEGKGGGIPSTQPEAPKTYATTADRMAALKNLFRSMDQAQPGA